MLLDLVLRVAAGRARLHDRHGRAVRRDARHLAGVRGSLPASRSTRSRTPGPWTGRAVLRRCQGRSAGACARRRRLLDHRRPARAGGHARGRDRARATTSASGCGRRIRSSSWTEREIWNARQSTETCRTTRCTIRATPRSAARPAPSRARAASRSLGRVARRPSAACMSDIAARRSLTHLELLEAEAIHIIREVAAELEHPVLLFSGGKDSIVLLRLAEKAFRPAPDPVRGHARRHRAQLRRGHRLPRPQRRASRRRADRRLRAGLDRPRSRARGDRPATRRATGCRP